jgi:hypothetical protein
MATSGSERDQALAWIASQLRWERALARLRQGLAPAPEIERQAA